MPLMLMLILSRRGILLEASALGACGSVLSADCNDNIIATWLACDCAGAFYGDTRYSLHGC